MDFLPYNNISISKPSFIEKDYFTILSEFKEVVNDIVNGSCMAMAIGEEIIWNEYDNFLSYSEKIHQDIIRKHIASNLSFLFSEIYNKNKNTQLYFYLYEENPLLIIAFFNAIERSFTLKFFK